MRDGYVRAGALAPTWPTTGPRAPVRDVLAEPGWLHDLTRHPQILASASAALGAEAHPVRANLFVKSDDVDWGVAWHQDRVVCVLERAEHPDFHGWSTKGGLPHANAPLRVLARMVAVRLHLDPCPEDAGPLEVVPGTHNRIHATGQVPSSSAVALPAEQGEMIIMRPLLVHRSQSQRRRTLRRVLHIEFAADPLPGPLRWNYW